MSSSSRTGASTPTAEAKVRETMISPLALESDPLLHYSGRQDVVIWPLQPV